VLRRWSPDVASATAALPVQQASKIEMFLNLKTARALGITIPLPLSGRADEIFE
jgi:putative tryptophan/tyrosine transport system substrate-binding protein